MERNVGDDIHILQLHILFFDTFNADFSFFIYRPAGLFNNDLNAMIWHG